MRSNAQSRGIALVLVLFVTALLTILVVEFAYSMQVYASVSANNRDEVQLRAGLHSGLATAEQLLLADLIVDTEDDVQLDHLEEPWAEEIAEIRLGDTTTRVTLTDEAGKFPLSALVEYVVEDGVVVESTVNEERREQLERLFKTLDLDMDLVHVLVDWLDHDTIAEPEGAEDEAYARAGHTCRNGPLTDISELEVLAGFTSEMVWGDPDDEQSLGLADVCTVFGRDDHLVNANTAPEAVLAALASHADVAREIIRARERGPFADTAEINDQIGDTGITQFLTTESGVWSVRIVSETARGDKKLALSAEGVLFRYVDEGDDAEGAQPSPGRANGEPIVAERGVIDVVAWREVR